MILAFDTSTAACTAALFDGNDCIARRDELIGRGHAERLVPMIAELLDGRTAESIIVGVGPGSFTGIRVGIAAAHGLAIGWNAEVQGMSSLALLAAAADREGPVAAIVDGGHGEVFVQEFDGQSVQPLSELYNLPPHSASALVRSKVGVGPGAERLIGGGWSGEGLEAWPSAAYALRLPVGLRSLAAKPLYARAPDASVRNAA